MFYKLIFKKKNKIYYGKKYIHVEKYFDIIHLMNHFPKYYNTSYSKKVLPSYAGLLHKESSMHLE